MGGKNDEVWITLRIRKPPKGSILESEHGIKICIFSEGHVFSGSVHWCVVLAVESFNKDKFPLVDLLTLWLKSLLNDNPAVLVLFCLLAG